MESLGALNPLKKGKTRITKTENVTVTVTKFGAA